MVATVDTSKMVFVFGSNEGGIHGAGAARFAHDRRGAEYKCGFGHMNSGTSPINHPGCFAIPTKGAVIHPTGRHIVGPTLSLVTIQRYVDAFLLYAAGRSDLTFQVTCIGCGLAGLEHKEVAPMFTMATPNCYFDAIWRRYLPGHNFWGTF